MFVETAQLEVNERSTFVPFLEKKNNVLRQELIRTITETADAYTQFTLLKNAIIPISNVKTTNEPLRVETIKEVSNMDKKILVKNIYNYTIGISLLAILGSIFLLTFDLFNISKYTLIFIILFASIGSFTVAIDARDFYKKNYKDIKAYEKKAREWPKESRC